MSHSPTHDAETTTAPPRPARRRLHAGDLWIVLAVGAVVFLFLFPTDEGKLVDTLVSLLYGPTAFVIIAIVLVEFLILKARDRSRFYRLQLQMLTNRRREDLSLMREMRDALGEAQQDLDEIAEEVTTGDLAADQARERLAHVTEMLEQIKADIQRR